MSMRYDRQILLPEIGKDGQQKIGEASVLVIGCGALGSLVAGYLAGAGTGRIGLVDYDVVDQSNLHRQLMFTEKDVGILKANALKNRLLERNSTISVAAFFEEFGVENGRELSSGYDILVDCTDRIESRYAIDSVTSDVGKPWVYGAVHGFEGQVSVFNFKGGPRYRDLFPEENAAAPNCEELGVLGPVPGVVASIQSNEVLKLITGFGSPVSGRVLLFDARNTAFSEIAFERKEKAQRPAGAEKGKFNTLVPSGLIKLLKERKDVQLVDMRDDPEETGLEKKVMHIPEYEIRERFSELDKTLPVVLLCRAGVKSRLMASLMARSGFREVYSLTGGTVALKQAVNK